MSGTAVAIYSYKYGLAFQVFCELKPRCLAQSQFGAGGQTMIITAIPPRIIVHVLIQFQNFNTLLGVSCYKYSTMGPKTLF